MTTPAQTQARRFARRVTTVSGLLAVLALGMAAPASADVPVGWSDPAAVDPLHGLLVVFAIPVLLAVVIGAIIYLPPLLRGESVAPGAPTISNQWLGGPSKTAGELAGPDGEQSQAGGASAQW